MERLRKQLELIYGECANDPREALSTLRAQQGGLNEIRKQLPKDSEAVKKLQILNMFVFAIKGIVEQPLDDELHYVALYNTEFLDTFLRENNLFSVLRANDITMYAVEFNSILYVAIRPAPLAKLLMEYLHATIEDMKELIGEEE